jgi:hypothetical protein
LLAQRQQTQTLIAAPPAAVGYGLCAGQQLLAGVGMQGRVQPDEETVGIEAPAYQFVAADQAQRRDGRSSEQA